MKIAVLGSGGVGGYFGARLANAGYDVTFVARGRHLAAIRANGLRVQSPLGDALIEQPKVVENIDLIEHADLVLLAVKLWDTDEAVRSLVPIVERGATVVSFQNGVQKDDVLKQYLPDGSYFGGISYIAARISEPGVIEHSGTLQRLVFGEFDGSRSPRVQAFYEACVQAGITTELTTDIKRAIWEKYVFLVGLSGTTASVRKPIGFVRENSRTRAFLLEVMREVVAVGRAMGVALPEDYAEDRLAFCDTIPATMTSSMHHDLEAGNRMELPWLSGGVSEMGKKLGVPTPKNSAIADILELHAQIPR